jgi:hypothetical protein
MKAKAFSTGSSWLWEEGKRCGNAAASRLVRSSGRSQPQHLALPAWGESCWPVSVVAIAARWLLNSNAPATAC